MKKLAWFGGMSGLVLGALAACSSAPGPATEQGSSGAQEKDAASFQRDGSVYDSAVSPESGLGELLFRPDHVYLGTDGIRTFRVPIAVYDSDADLAVTADDPAALTLAKATLQNPVNDDGVTDNGKYFLVTANKPGTFTLTARSGGRTTTAAVTVASYEGARWAAGEARYTAEGTGADRPCTACHQSGAAIDHSPAALATATDQEIGIIITTGVKPGPSVIKLPNEPGTPHKWNVTDPEKDGLITYLRGLSPRGFQ